MEMGAMGRNSRDEEGLTLVSSPSDFENHGDVDIPKIQIIKINQHVCALEAESKMECKH